MCYFMENAMVVFPSDSSSSYPTKAMMKFLLAFHRLWECGKEPEGKSHKSLGVVL